MVFPILLAEPGFAHHVPSASPEPARGTAAAISWHAGSGLPTFRIPGTGALLDLDHFKKINDTWGHEAGVAAIVATGARLARWAGPGIVGRLGGDEFAALTRVPAPAGDPTAAGRAHRQKLAELKHLLSQPVETPAGLMPVTASVGGASARHLDVDELPLLLRAADQAMYRAKHRPQPAWAEQDDLACHQVNGRRQGRPGTALLVESQPA
ncbi:GGDEF domain-containing protein [Streptomyces albidoflavus]